MPRRSGNIRSGVGVMAGGLALLMNACASGVTAPVPSPSSSILQHSPQTVGALTISWTTMVSWDSTLANSVLQVSVTVKNDSTAPVSLSYGCGGLWLTLYRTASPVWWTATHTGSPVWPGPGYVTCALMWSVQVQPGQSKTFTDEVPMSRLRQDIGTPGTYYVTASIDGWTVDAGTVTVH